ncbi:MAG: DNA repair protein RecN [Dehalococcoidia bacterium]|nr:DNA repair protein RecN [Dehalococcoidia bacterium]
MLRLLSVTNFATIEQLELELAPGFNVLTGETGAGKSIIVDALSLLLGGRADVGMVRSGARQARVEGIFLLNGDLARSINAALAEYEVEGGEEELILAREVNLEGRNTSRVNGRIVPLRLLSALAEHLVDIHGQNQHLSLFRVREHMDILDKYGGLWQLRTQVAEKVHRLTEVRRELDRLLTEEQELARRVDFLRYQVTEIGAANLRPAEDEDLVLERDRIANAERITALSDHAYRALYDGFDRQESVMDLMGQVAQDLAQLKQLDPSLGQDLEQADALAHQVEELGRTLRSYRDGIEYDPDRLQELEGRLDLIRGLKRKYGSTVEEVLAFAERASTELEELCRSEERTGELKSREVELREQVGRLAGRLSAARRDAAKRLAGAIEEEVAGLAVQHANVDVDVSQTDSEEGVPVGAGDPGTYSAPLGEDGVRRYAFNGTGIDSVELLVSLNLGEPPRPLARIASGGEAARLMLAIKTILTSSDRIPVLVFDEVDAGIGGRVGSLLGRKLWGLSKSHQVLCVTHLPQIAGYADRHARVVKSTSHDRTVTAVEVLAGEVRVTELSQMLGSDSGVTRSNALEMLEQAARWKGSRGEVT